MTEIRIIRSLLAAVLSVCFCYELLFLLFKVFHFQFFVFISLFNYYFFYKILILFFFSSVPRIYSEPMPCSRDFLLSLSKVSSSPPRTVRWRVFFFNLKSCSSSSVLNSISSSTTSTFSSSTFPHSSLISFSHLKSKSFFLNSNSSNSSHNSSKLLKSINISFLNIRSLNNKFIHVFNLLSDSNLDFLALSETWHESAPSPSLIFACPPSYSFLELACAPQNPLSTSLSTYEEICLFLQIYLFLF